MSAKAYSILIVDDEVELCETVASAFELKGHNVKKATSGRSALELVKSEKVDLVLTDVRMSEGDGIELLNFIKAMNLDKPLVALMTGYADVTREEMYELGAEAVFEKPFKVMELIRQVVKKLENKENRWNEKPNVLPVLKLQSTGNDRYPTRLGRGGISMGFNQEEPRSGQIVEFVAQIPEIQDPLRGLGTVRWVKAGDPNTCGIEFLYLDEPTRTTVLKLIDKKKPRTFIPKS